MCKVATNILALVLLFGSSWLNAQTEPPSPIPIAPSNHATGIRINTTFIWRSVKEADSYDLQVSTDSTFFTVVINRTGLTDTTYQLPGLSHKTIYFWRIRSANALRTGPFSLTFSFRTRVASALEGEIESSSAVTILRHVAGLSMLSGDGLEWADVSEDGTVSAYDAAIVLQAAAGLLSKLPGAQ